MLGSERPPESRLWQIEDEADAKSWDTQNENGAGVGARNRVGVSVGGGAGADSGASTAEAREYRDADEQHLYSRTGIYLSVGLIGGSYTEAESTLEDLLGGLNVDVDDSIGAEFVVGVRVHRHAALEVELEYLSESDISVSGLGKVADLQTFSFSINGKAYPLTGRVQPYGLLGFGFMESKLEIPTTDVTANGFAVRFGGGVEIYLTQMWVLDLGVDYLLPGSSDVEDLNYVSFGGGLMVRF